MAMKTRKLHMHTPRTREIKLPVKQATRLAVKPPPGSGAVRFDHLKATLVRHANEFHPKALPRTALFRLDGAIF